MKVVYSLLITLATVTGFSVSAQTVKPNNTLYTTKLQETPPIEISVQDNRIIISNAPVGSTLEIYSVVGIKVREIEIKQSSGEYPVNIAKGYYIIRIADTVRKIAIR